MTKVKRKQVVTQPSEFHRACCRIVGTWICVFLWMLVVNVPSTRAQSVWEVTPYAARVWWSIGQEPNLPAKWREGFHPQLADQLQLAFRAAWNATVEPAPDEFQSRMRGDLSRIQEERAYQTGRALNADKLYFVSVAGHDQSYRIQVREFDCLLGYFGPVDEDQVYMLNQVANRATQMIVNSFSPVIQIDRFSSGQVRARLKAASLIQPSQSIGRLNPGDVLLPFERRIGVTGATRLQDNQIIDWTYIVVPNEAANSDELTLDVISGYKQAFRSKRNRRRQQLAIRTRPSSDRSTIRLLSRSDASPLIGYEIHEKGAHQTRFLGYTDWRGELVVQVAQSPVRTLLVRSGDRVLAKLPIVPGLRPVIAASLTDNRQRVEIDGFLSGIQIALVDLVARRESLTTRIRRRIADGDWSGAASLLEVFRSLPTQADFQRQVEQQQQSLSVTDPELRKSIDTMFVDTYRTLGQYLDPGRLRQLESELAAAKPQ